MWQTALNANQSSSRKSFIVSTQIACRPRLYSSSIRTNWQPRLGQAKTYGGILRSGNWGVTKIDNYAGILDREITKRVESGRKPDQILRQTGLLVRSLNHFYRRAADDFNVDQGTFKSPWPPNAEIDTYVSTQTDDTVYLMNDEGTLGFVKVFAVEQETDFTGVTSCLDRLREHVAAINDQYADNDTIQLSLTGIPVLENDEMRRSQTDMLKACGLALLAVGTLLFVGFRGIRHPMLAILMLIIAMTWTFGFTTAVIGHFNIISISFAVILIGLGIDFAIHYLSSYLQLRHEGEDLYHGLVKASGSVGTGIMTAALTTALAFLSAIATDFGGRFRTRDDCRRWNPFVCTGNVCRPACTDSTQRCGC